ncbi:hypothetical protein NL676_034210 [Syzygium grande]|nr:hypothetical protein NL676_034210 [Syzygium grande]
MRLLRLLHHPSSAKHRPPSSSFRAAASSTPPSSVICKASATTPVTRGRGAIPAFLLAHSLAGTPRARLPATEYPRGPARRSFPVRGSHDAGTYDVRTKTAGSNGSIRNKEEYSHDANAGLKIPLDFCGEHSLLFLSYLPLGFSAFTVLIPLVKWCLRLFDIRALKVSVHLFMHRRLWRTSMQL